MIHSTHSFYLMKQNEYNDILNYISFVLIPFSLATFFLFFFVECQLLIQRIPFRINCLRFEMDNAESFIDLRRMANQSIFTCELMEAENPKCSCICAKTLDACKRIRTIYQRKIVQIFCFFNLKQMSQGKSKSWRIRTVTTYIYNMYGAIFNFSLREKKKKTSSCGKREKNLIVSEFMFLVCFRRIATCVFVNVYFLFVVSLHHFLVLSRKHKLTHTNTYTHSKKVVRPTIRV